MEKQYFEWGTIGITPDGHQLIHLYFVRADHTRSTPVRLDETQSTLLNACLHEIAQDTSISWTAARQAVLRAFYTTLNSAPQSN